MPQLEARHQTSGLNTRFGGQGLAFAEYIAKQREIIARTRVGSSPSRLAKIVEGNAPFALAPTSGFAPGADKPNNQGKPYKRGVLLVHGLTDSPYFMRHLGTFFQARGYRVLAVLLPGHGTQPGDLLHVQWQEWAATVAYGADALAAEADEIYLAGYSAGGTLCIDHSLHDVRVRGLFLYAPALRINPRAAWAKLHKLYSWFMPEEKWIQILSDTDIYKYESMPKNAAAQMYALIQHVRRQLEKNTVGIPVFTVASADDVTVDPAATVSFMAHTNHPCNKLVYYTTQPKNPLPGIASGKAEQVNSALPAQGIVSASHTAIVLPPEDTHYGIGGDYRNFNHYYVHERARFEACTQHPEQALQGEISDENLHAGPLRRLMYNPNFAALTVSMQHFMHCVQQQAGDTP